MGFNQELNYLSRGQLYVMIKELNEEISCLKTDLIKYKFVSNSYKKYFEFLSQINETIPSNEEVLDLVKDIKLFNSLTGNKCSVILKRLTDNCLNESGVQRVEQKCSESQETIESKPTESQNQRTNERNDTSDEIPERKPIKTEIKIEDIEEENNSSITESLIEKKPNIEEISINLTANLENEVKTETNISDIKFNSKSGHQLNQTLKQNVVKTETQRDDKSEEVSNESQTTIEAIKECKPEEEECIECIDITDNDSDIEQVIDGCDEEDMNENHSKTANQLITQTTEDIFICDINSTNLKSQDSFSEHKNRHTNKCLCNVGSGQYIASKLADLNRHRKVHGDTDKPEDNNINLEQMSGNRFITQIQNYSEIGFKCEVCSAIFKSRLTLIQHKNNHSNKHLCNWYGCQFRGKSPYDLGRHRTQVHSKIKTFNYYFKDSNKRIKIENNSNECLIPQKTQISDKTQENNDSKLGLKCEVCSAIFNTRKTLLQHKNIHTNKYFCGWNRCQFRGISASALRRHRKVHLKAKVIKDSNKCIEIENNSNEFLVSQKIQINDKTQENNELNEISVQPNDQIMENDTHLETGRRSPLKVFNCEVKGCEKVCHTSSGLVFHKNTHSDKYLCGINGCQKRAGSRSDLDRHKQFIHSNERPHICVVNGCDKRFKSKCNVKQHMKSTHKLSPDLVKFYVKNATKIVPSERLYI